MFGFAVGWGVFWLLIWLSTFVIGNIANNTDLKGYGILGILFSTIYLIALSVGRLFGG
jgi:hypothetical protein